MAFGSENDIKIRIEVDNAGAVRILDQMGKKLGEFGNEAEAASKDLKKMSAEADNSASAFGRLKLKLQDINPGTIIAGLSAAIAGGLAAIVKGSEIAQVEDAFDKLAQKAGALSDVLLNDLKDATDGTISRLDLLKVANDGLIGGLKPEQLVTFAKAADVVADATGGDARAGFERLVNAIVKGRGELVATELGIQNFNQQVAEIAKGAGLAADKLNETQQRLISVYLATQAAEEKAAQFSATTKTSGDIVQGWKVEIENATTALLSTVGRSEALNQILLGLDETIRSLTGALKEGATAIATFGEGVFDLNTFAAAAGPQVGALVKGLELLRQKGAAQQGSPLVDLFAKQTFQENFIGPIQSQASQAAKKSTDALSDSLKNLRAELVKNSTAAKDVKDKYDATGEAMVALYKANKELTSFEGIQKQTRQFQDLFKALNAGSITTDQYGKFFSDTIKQAIDAGISPEEIAKQISKALEDAAGKVGKGQFSFADLLRKVVTDGGGSATEAQIAGDLAPTLEGAFGTASDLAIAAISGEDSTKLQRSKAIGAAIGGIIGGIVAGYLTAGIGTAAGAAIGSAIGEAIGAAIGKESKNASKKARKAFDAALIDEFKKNPVQIVDPIEGVGEKLKDLDLEARGTEVEEYKKKLEELRGTLGDGIAGALNSAAIALEQFAQELGIDADKIRGQLFDVLLGNLGPNILNLKALFQSLGKDADDVRGLLYKAFLQGAISANELLTLLRQVSLIFSDGIPTAIGAVDEAFKQFQALAGKGGASSFEALKAIAVEALEAGATTFDQLANLLINQYGFAADQVNQLLQAMKLAGLNNLQDLAKASQETLLAVLSNIQELLKGGTNFVTGEAFAGLLPKPKSTGGGSRVDEAKEAARATLAAVQATDEYKLAIDALRTGELSRAQVQKVVNGLVKEYTELTKAREDLESKLADILKKGGKITAEQARQLQKLTEAVENFGKVGEKGFRTFNKELVKFSKTVGDDLNKLILAANAAGISLEDLKKPIVEAFAAGKLSAEEAFKQLQKYEQGLGGVGNTAREALDNLLKAGTSGGAVSLDALKDIAGEAIKLGGQSILDLENQLRAQGVGDDRISQLLRAIADAGVTSLDQLANANDETAIRIIAKAKEFGLPFQETGNEIKKLLDDLQKIRESPEIKVKIGLDASPKLEELLNIVAGRTRQKGKNPARGNTTQPNA
jgi:hypothetical protein